MYVLFEGLPGSGKSTLIRYLCKVVSCSVIPDIGNPKFLHQDFITNYEYALFVEMLKSRLSKLAKYEYVLQERGFLSVLAYHYAQDRLQRKSELSTALMFLEEKIEKRELILPDLLVIANIDPKSSILRQPNTMTQEWKNADWLTYISEFYNDFNKQNFYKIKSIVLDSSLSIIECIDRTLESMTATNLK